MDGELILTFKNGNPISIERNISMVVEFIRNSNKIDLCVDCSKPGYFTLSEDRVVDIVREIAEYHLNDIINGDVESLNTLYDTATGHYFSDLDDDTRQRLTTEWVHHQKKLGVVSRKLNKLRFVEGSRVD